MDRDFVRFGVVIYLGVQTASAGFYTLVTARNRELAYPHEQPFLMATPSPWSALPEPDLDSTSTTNMVNSMVASSTWRG